MMKPEREVAAQPEAGRANSPSGQSGEACDHVAARKPYRAPSVQKRRSLVHATLVSGGGTAGTLAGGAGP